MRTLAPRTATSPVWPGLKGAPVSLTTRTSTPGRLRPTLFNSFARGRCSLGQPVPLRQDVPELGYTFPKYCLGHRAPCIAHQANTGNIEFFQVQERDQPSIDRRYCVHMGAAFLLDRTQNVGYFWTPNNNDLAAYHQATKCRPK